MNRVRIVNLVVSAVALAAWACPAPGQTLPSAGSVLRQQEMAAPAKPAQLPAAQSKELVTTPAPVLAGEVRILVKSIRFSGTQGLASEGELQGLVQDNIGKELGTGQLQQLADRVTEFLKSRGWFSARASLPEQDLTDGKLEISISTGRVDGGLQGIELKASDSRLKEQHVRAVLAATLPGVASLGLNLQHLEHALLVLNELPGVNSQASLARGKDSNSTRLQIEIAEGPVLLSSATLDNFGSRYTGTVRGTGQVRILDPYGAGDQVTLGAVGAAGVAMGTLGYSRPLGASGLNWGLNASTMRYSIGADLSNLDLSGSASTAGVSLGYPFLLSNNAHLRGTLGADYKALVDSGNGATLRDKRLLNAVASLTGDRMDDLGGGALNNFSLALTLGRLDLAGSASDLAADQAGPRANGSFNKVTYSLSRLQKLPGAFTLFASLNGQFANTNLDSSEKFILGGSSGVRAYPSGEGSGDSGWGGSLEARYDMPAATSLGNLQWFAFIDTGHVTLNSNVWGAGAVSNAEGVNSYGLSGAGFGLALTRPGSHTVRALWTQAVGSNPGRSVAGNNSDGLADRSRFVLMSSFYF
ncbi:MAG: ShlB/FhaC/HecB family hemolysin secretion/activation protein [Comamonadaceae bacterium]